MSSALRKLLLQWWPVGATGAGAKHEMLHKCGMPEPRLFPTTPLRGIWGPGRSARRNCSKSELRGVGGFPQSEF